MPERRPQRPQDKPADLEQIVDAFDMQCEGIRLYYDCDTGEVVHVSDEFDEFSDSDSDDDSDDSMPHWQREECNLARAVDEDEEGARFVPLPDQFEIHEWDIMRHFAESVEDDNLSGRLRNAIHGKGAFRYFKDALYEAGIQNQWFAFRKQAFLEIAHEWAQQHNIPLKRAED